MAEPFVVDSPASWTPRETPGVSVIIPCFNEEHFIGKALENLAGQYPSQDFEIVVVDGNSTDRTLNVVAEFHSKHPDTMVTIIDNPARNIPTALNLGIRAARGEIIARMDAHASPSHGYIRRCVEILQQGDAEVVGMPCRVRPGAETATAIAIALAVSHPFGIGDAKYRLGGAGNLQEEVDTVAFACFRKSLWAELNGFDENLLTNEDYDFNYRARTRGERVVLDRSAYCDYFARPTLSKLASQYLRYGYWKARMINQQPRSIRLRHVAAPVFVTSIVLLLAAGFWLNVAWLALALVMSAYIVAATYFSFQTVRQTETNLAALFYLPLAFVTIHISWGSSFLWGLVRPQQRGSKG